MERGEDLIQGAGGIPLFIQWWRPEAPRGALAVVHGLGEHGGHYGGLAEYMGIRGLAVYAVDLRGHGRSGGQRGHIKSWSDYRDDAHRLVERASSSEPGLPLFLLGHSVGGLVALELALRAPAPLSGVICSAPILGKIGISPVLWVLARLLNRLCPRFSVRLALSSARTSRDPAVQAEDERDPLMHSRGTARLGVEVPRTIDWVQSQGDRFPVPLLILHGADDDIADPEGSRRFVASMRLSDRRLIEYAGGLHEPFSDLTKDQASADAADWILARL